jgi:hypothetical protein
MLTAHRVDSYAGVVLHLLGGLYISFAGQQTPLIPYDASEELIRYRLLVGLLRFWSP